MSYFRHIFMVKLEESTPQALAIIIVCILVGAAIGARDTLTLSVFMTCLYTFCGAAIGFITGVIMTVSAAAMKAYDEYEQTQWRSGRTH